jgi:hypothetical protein
MKRPRIPPKPPAPSVRQYLAGVVDRTRRLKPDEQPKSRSDLVGDIARKLNLPDVVLQRMREQAKRDDE